jgi:hypothetical protein
MCIAEMQQTGYHTGRGNRQPAKQTALAPETAFIADMLPHRQGESIYSRHPITTQARRQPPRRQDYQTGRRIGCILYSRLADRKAGNMYVSLAQGRQSSRQAGRQLM